MKHTGAGLIVMGCIGICFLLLGLETTNSSEEAQEEGVVETVVIEEEDIELPLQPDSEQTGEEEPVKRAIFISIPEAFEDLDRAPVKYYHDKHALALEKEGCENAIQGTKKTYFSLPFPRKGMKAATMPL